MQPWSFFRLALQQQPVLAQSQFFHSGRGALYFAAKALATAACNVVLLPAYHCPALVEPFIAAGYQIRFYPLAADLSIEQEQLSALLSADVTHCLVVRYFGNSLNTEQILAQLSARGIITFDDCAHDLKTFLQHPLHASARICSLKKFIASADGGLLQLQQPVKAELESHGLLRESKNLLGLMRQQLSERLRDSQNSRLYPSTDQKAIAASPVMATSQSCNSGLRYLTPIHQRTGSYLASGWQLRWMDLAATFARRQQHAQFLQTQLQHSALGRLLWSELSADSAPYVVPFLLNDSAGFDLLRSRGLQVLRWEELAPGNCPVSASYRSRLIQLPCHQELTTEQLADIVQAMHATPG
jgi:dTDP-4-amino-4,6-dideoxygalactose transaminase